MTSNRVNQITTGLVYFVIVYGISVVICNTLQGWNIFPTYTVCMLDPVIEQEDNFVAMAFFVMPSALMANAAPIIDLVTFRLMKLWQNSRQIPKGTLKINTICIGKKTFFTFQIVVIFHFELRLSIRCSGLSLVWWVSFLPSVPPKSPL